MRVLQEGEIRPLGASESRVVDARIIAATSKTLEEEMKNGNFREDLYYRLNVMSIHLPPLAEHSEDIPLLCQFFMDRYNRKFGKAVQTISPAAMSMLLEYQWPGNVRELENMIERGVVLAEEQELGPENFPIHLQRAEMNRGKVVENVFSGFSLKTGKVRMEEAMIRKALAKTRGNRTQAAKLLEISHPSLLSKIKRYAIDE